MFTNKPHDVCCLTAADALIDHQAHELDPVDARRAYRTLIRQLSGKPRNSYQSTISTQRRLVFLITTRTLPLLRTTGPRLLGGLRAKLRNNGAELFPEDGEYSENASFQLDRNHLITLIGLIRHTGVRLGFSE